MNPATTLHQETIDNVPQAPCQGDPRDGSWLAGLLPCKIWGKSAISIADKEPYDIQLLNALGKSHGHSPLFVHGA